MLQVWFPAHWVPFVLNQLQHKEEDYRAANPSGMDQNDVSVAVQGGEL